MKVTWRKMRPGETMFGGRGVLISIDKKRMLSSAESSNPAKTDPTDPMQERMERMREFYDSIHFIDDKKK